jgi:hypothetical protein
MGCTNMLNIPIIYPYLTLSVSCINLVIKSMAFVTLQYMTYYYHKYVFECFSRSDLKLFIFDFFSYGINIAIFTIERHNHEHFRPLMDIVLVIYLVNVPIIIISYAILRLKFTDDVISEISKLDNIMIVSIFQRQKLPESELIIS